MKKLSIILSVLVFASCMAEKPKDKNSAKADNKTEQNLQLENQVEKNLTLVKVLSVSPQNFKHTFSVSGAVEAVKFAAISPDMNGRIVKILAKEGQVVKKGTLLVQLDNRLLKTQLQTAQTSLELAQTMYEKQKELWDKKIGTEVQYLQSKNRKESIENQIATLKVQLSMTQVKAPFTGIVDRIYQKEGELANPARQLIDFVNLNRLYINADISEDYVGKIKQGDEAVITFPAFPGLQIKAKVYRTGDIINPSSRSFRTRFIIANPNNKIKPNLVALVHLSDYQTNDALLVPSIVIQRDMQGEYIYLVDKNKGVYKARKQYVKTGLSNSGMTQIKEGLRAGEKVIVKGYNLVRRGQEVMVK